MDEVMQAFALSKEKKAAALGLYKEAVLKMVTKGYVAQDADAHTELSAIFGVMWLCTQKCTGAFWMDGALYAEANVAFNYANLRLGMRNKFVALAKNLVGEGKRINDKELEKMQEEMDCLLTCTTAEKVSKELACE